MSSIQKFEADANGNYPAVEAIRAKLGRKLAKLRHAANLTIATLAERAGIRPQLLKRIEQREVSPSVKLVEQLDRILSKG